MFIKILKFAHSNYSLRVPYQLSFGRSIGGNTLTFQGRITLLTSMWAGTLILQKLKRRKLDGLLGVLSPSQASPSSDFCHWVDHCSGCVINHYIIQNKILSKAVLSASILYLIIFNQYKLTYT